MDPLWMLTAVTGAALALSTTVHSATVLWAQRLESGLREGNLARADRYFKLLLAWAPRRLEFTPLWNKAALDVRLLHSELPSERLIDHLLGYCRTVERDHPRLIALRRLQAHLLRQQGNLDEARTVLEAVPRRHNPVDGQQRGIFYELVGDLERAREEYQQARAQLSNPGVTLKLALLPRLKRKLMGHLLRSLAQVSTRLGRLDEAIEALDAAIGNDPGSLESIYSRIAVAGLRERLHGVEAAEASLRKDLEAMPGHAGLFLQTLGEVQTRAGRLEEAGVSLGLALEYLEREAGEAARSPRYISLLLARVELEMARGDRAAARESLELLRDQVPDHALVNQAWATFFEAQGDDHSALAYLERAVGQPGATSHQLVVELTRPGARVRLAECYRRLGRPQDAEAEYRRAIKTGEAPPAILAGLGYLLAEQGRKEESQQLLESARTEFQERLRRNPSDGELLTGLGRLLAFQGDLEGARAQLERAVAQSPRDQGAWSALGETCLKLGRSHDAAPALRRAEQLARRPDQRRRLQELLARIEPG